MIYRVPKKLLATLQDYLIDVYLPPKKRRFKTDSGFNDKDLLIFAKGAGRMSNAFTKGRQNLPKNYLNMKEFRAGYILYFTVTNYLKALFCLEEIGARDLFPKGADILDLGCGPGTSLLAATDHFKAGGGLRLTGVDQNRHILKDASILLDRYTQKGFHLKTVCARISGQNIRHTLGDKRYQIIFLSNILGEFDDIDQRLRLIQAVEKNNLASEGFLIIIEPALQHTTRELMTVRDLLLSRSERRFTVSSPCMHELPCPMLKSNRRDWCHMYLMWERPELIEKIDRLIGNKKDYLKFSYLILTNVERRTSNVDIWRVVSAPLRSKGKTEFLVCNTRGLNRLVMLDKNKDEKNKTFDLLKRGDLISYSGPMKVLHDSEIKLLTNRHS